MDSAETQELFEQTLLGKYDDEEPWEAVSSLQRNGTREIFDTAALWLSDSSPLRRARAAAILAQLRAAEDEQGDPYKPNWLFRDESFGLLSGLLERETEALVLDNAIAALGHLSNESAVPLLVTFKDHLDHEVRFSVAFSLGNYPNNPVAIPALVALTRDEDANVRDWAVFGLGVQGDADSSEIREALFERIDDPDEDVREEALVGLGKRRDPRAIPALRAALDDIELKVRIAEAASAMLGLTADPEDWKAGDYKKALSQEFGV